MNQPKQTTSENTPSTALSEQVRDTLAFYFDDLQDGTANDLYELVIQQVEKPLIEFVLEQTNQNQTKTAQILGINRNTLRKKMQKYQLI